jgi:fatty-acyl-CoA synthase
MRRVINEMHQSEITIAYGMTETSPVSFQSSTDDPLERRVSTVGRIHPHLEVKIVDADGRIVPRGEKGELLTRGYSVMRGYWNDPQSSAGAVDDAGWMHTGDLATIDAEGYCNIVGRIKDLIIRGGENIYPREIEEFLFTHPAISDVQIFGIPDRRFGEVICAWVKLSQDGRLNEAELVSFCQQRIAHYKIPAHIRFVDQFPMTVTGKIQKFVMRQTMIEELELEEIKTA